MKHNDMGWSYKSVI